jgi:hypothetical protein
MTAENHHLNPQLSNLLGSYPEVGGGVTRTFSMQSRFRPPKEYSKLM